jgi:lipopolysaccharide/colanic/teichoic acid biosynthesis glycosyltransferase
MNFKKCDEKSPLRIRCSEIIKRTIDLSLALILLIVFSPIMTITAIAIKLTSKGPVLLDSSVPPRVGRGGKHFRLFKFRSMIVNAHQLLRTDPKLKKLYEEYKKNSYKLSDDPRVTFVGKFIRKHSIDELPQLFNVIKGEMSIVGPRPYLQEELDNQQKKYPHTKQYVQKMLRVKPGITGLWQVSGRSNVNFDKRIVLDAEYAEQRSFLFDIIILIKSPWTMITGKGAS